MLNSNVGEDMTAKSESDTRKMVLVQKEISASEER